MNRIDCVNGDVVMRASENALFTCSLAQHFAKRGMAAAEADCECGHTVRAAAARQPEHVDDRHVNLTKDGKRQSELLLCDCHGSYGSHVLRSGPGFQSWDGQFGRCSFSAAISWIVVELSGGREHTTTAKDAS